MPTSTVENYLKQIYLEQQSVRGLVSMGKLAAALNVSPSTATAMVKTLADSALVNYAPRGGVKLTRSGEKLALHVLRRHRLLELFLVRVLKLDWSEVHQEAEELEHALSSKVLERIDAYLGRPTVDPHGDPIPSASGRVAQAPIQTLAECPAGRRVLVTRIMDQDPKFLQFANRVGLTPGSEVTVKQCDPQADAIAFRPRGGKAATLGSATAAKILVQAVGEQPVAPPRATRRNG
jgi:DtxR family transcriptional regulator, Mn-dependent transcriptional regulator